MSKVNAGTRKMDYRDNIQNQPEEQETEFIIDPNENPAPMTGPDQEVFHVRVRPTPSGLLSINVIGTQPVEVVRRNCPMTTGLISPVSSSSSMTGEAPQWPAGESSRDAREAREMRDMRDQMESSDEEYARIVRKSELLGAPYENASQGHPSDEDPIDSFIHFVRSLLRSFQDDELKLKVMDDISQTVINAKSEEIKRIKK
ncbi:uncharacterized protein LOC113494357 isoform X1 [Trichoplusia ni]|uniref:Uncharacterized protein LOC113494357 isoform X1 n=2 Tax=Trichoplusia ni TaxID=7111 RepID=A0A7E5VJL1_TRINI|nr:uncharacterized protein LOC113494357 isoform X1 [Trichoplusia ni]